MLPKFMVKNATRNVGTKYLPPVNDLIKMLWHYQKCFIFI